MKQFALFLILITISLAIQDQFFRIRSDWLMTHAETFTACEKPPRTRFEVGVLNDKFYEQNINPKEFDDKYIVVTHLLPFKTLGKRSLRNSRVWVNNDSGKNPQPINVVASNRERSFAWNILIQMIDPYVDLVIGTRPYLIRFYRGQKNRNSVVMRGNIDIQRSRLKIFTLLLQTGVPNTDTYFFLRILTNCTYLPNTTILEIKFPYIHSTLGEEYSINSLKNFPKDSCPIYLNNKQNKDLECEVVDNKLYIRNFITPENSLSINDFQIHSINSGVDFMGDIEFNFYNRYIRDQYKFISERTQLNKGRTPISLSNKSYEPSVIGQNNLNISFTVSCEHKIPLITGSYLLLSFSSGFTSAETININITSFDGSIIIDGLADIDDSSFKFMIPQDLPLDKSMTFTISGMNTPSVAKSFGLQMNFFTNSHKAVTDFENWVMTFSE